jgi:hypothetical protein
MNVFGKGAAWPTVALTGCVLALGACGGGDDDAGASDQTPADRSGLSELLAAGGEEAAVARSFTAFSKSLYAGKWEQACAMMTPAGRRQYAGGGAGCVGTFSLLGAKALRRSKPKLLGVEVAGDKAVLKVKAPSGPRDRVRFERRDGAWMVAGNVGSRR